MSKIRTYNELLQEEQRLQQQLKSQENIIRQDIAGMQENFEPIKKIYDTVHRIFTRDNRVPFFNLGLELGVDMLLRRFILARAGWFARIIVPYLVKNYSSHIIGEEKRKALVKKIRDMFNKVRPKAQAANGAM
jgi:hypothetical protein